MTYQKIMDEWNAGLWTPGEVYRQLLEVLTPENVEAAMAALPDRLRPEILARLTSPEFGLGPERFLDGEEVEVTDKLLAAAKLLRWNRGR